MSPLGQQESWQLRVSWSTGVTIGAGAAIVVGAGGPQQLHPMAEVSILVCRLMLEVDEGHDCCDACDDLVGELLLIAGSTVVVIKVSWGENLNPPCQ